MSNNKLGDTASIVKLALPFVIIFAILTTAVQANSQLRMYKIPPQQSSNIVKTPDYEYISSSDLLVVNRLSDKKNIVNDNSTFAPFLVDAMGSGFAKWKFFGNFNTVGNKKVDFGKISGTSALHNRTISLPDCTLGNVCNTDKFSVYLPNMNDAKSTQAKFYINKTDVTTLLYYTDGVFRIKEYYEQQFFENFLGDRNIFSWKLSDKSKMESISVHLAKYTIKGVVKAVDNHSLPYGSMKIVLNHAGSELFIPHKFDLDIQKDGTYELSGLPTLEYKVTVDIFPNTPPQLIAMDNNSLSLEHTLPKFDQIVEMQTTPIRASESQISPTAIKAGDFLVLSPSNLGLSSAIVSAKLSLPHNNVIYQVAKGRLSILIPSEVTSMEDFVFTVSSSGQTVLLRIKNAVTQREEHTQFGLYNINGRYAKTVIDNLGFGGVYAYSKMLMPTVTLDSASPVGAGNVKVHYYNSAGKTADISNMFLWKESSNTLTGIKDHQKEFYNILDPNGGTFAVTLCDKSNPDYCFRIKDTIRPGRATVKVSAQNVPSSAYMVLREVSNDNRVVKISPVKGEVAIFTDIPVGYYQLLLSDFGLNFYGSTFVEINSENLNSTVSAVLTATPIKGALDDNKVANIELGGLTPLIMGEYYLYQNDYDILDLKELAKIFNKKLNKVTSFKKLGGIPADILLYNDSSLGITTSKTPIYGKNSATLLLESDNMSYILPLRYRGDDYITVTEDGMDYTMCPSERPYCVNAFVELGGVRQGIYNGKVPLRIILPLSFNKDNLKVYMESDVDVTDMFILSPEKRLLTLKKGLIPAFLSTLATNKEPIIIKVRGRTYRLSLLAGYKTVEATVVDRQDSKAPFDGLSAKISCQYINENYFSQITSVKNTKYGSIATFIDLPDCTYDVTLLDKERLYYGSLNNIKLTSGESKLRTIFPVECIGSNDQFIENCQSFLPTMPNRTIVAPYLGVIFTDKLALHVVTKAATVPDKTLTLNKAGRGLIVYSPPIATPRLETQIVLYGENSNESVLPFTIRSLQDSLIKILDHPKGEKITVNYVSGVSKSFTYDTEDPLVVNISSSLRYTANELSIKIYTDTGEHEISPMFLWNSAKGNITLKKSYRAEFASMFGNKQRALKIVFAPHSDDRQSVVEITLGVGAADVEVVADKTATGKMANAKAILIGSSAKNGSEFRQEAEMGQNKVFRFTNIPIGVYDIVIFSTQSSAYGSREIAILGYGKDVYTDIIMKKIKN